MKKKVFSGLVIIFSFGVSFLFAELILKQLGINRYQTWLEMDEKGYIKNRANFKAFGYTFDGPTYYTFDEYRNRVTSFSEKSLDATQVLLLGDSFQFGLYLEDSVTITHRLNEYSSSGIRFENGGVGGSGTADHLWHLRNALEVNTPDIVLLMTNYDDVDRSIFKNLFVLKNGQLYESQRFKPTWVYHGFHLTQWHSWLEKHSYSYALISQVLWKYAFFYDDYQNIEKSPKFLWPLNAELYPENEYAVELWKALILEMKSLCKQQNVEFIIGNTGYLPDSVLNPRTYKVYQQMDSFLKENEFRFIDLRFEMEKAAQGDWKSLMLWPDNHPNAKATEIIAHEILRQYAIMN